MSAKFETIYVGGSSADLERAERAIACCRRAGLTVTHDWPAEIRAVGEANPVDASFDQRCDWSAGCLVGVEHAQLVWLLGGHSSKGMHVELGYAVARGIPVLISGGAAASIFYALGVEVETDDQAFEIILATLHDGRC